MALLVTTSKASYLQTPLRSTTPQRQPIKIYSLDSGKLVCWDKACLASPSRPAFKLYQAVDKVAIFFFSAFRLCGIDGKGKLPTFHIDWREENAAWACESGTCAWKFNNVFILPIVVCHEYTHAIIHEFTGLEGIRQPGALHESLADVMAIACSWFYGRFTWKVLDRDISKHYDIRAYKRAKVCSDENDGCYVHQNSLIPSHAFYHAASCSDFKKVACVWFFAMTRLKPNETFQSFAKKTTLIAMSFHVHSAVKQAWHHVGICPSS